MMNTAFIWSEHMGEIITTALLSMVPTFEGRYAIPIMLGMGMPVVFSYLLAVICSSVPVPVVLWMFKPVVQWIYTLPIAPLKKFAAWVERHSEEKAKKMNSIGLLGLFIFVAIPLPGTGAWTGSVIATIFNLNRPKSMMSIIAGNMVACLITTILSMGVQTVLP